MPLSTNNHWVQLAEIFSVGCYGRGVPIKLGRAAKPFRLLYGAQLIKQKYGWSDGCRGAYSANHIFAAFCMHINPKEKYKNRSFACKLFNDKEKQNRGNSIYERTLCDILRTRDESDSEQ